MNSKPRKRPKLSLKVKKISNASAEDHDSGPSDRNDNIVHVDVKKYPPEVVDLTQTDHEGGLLGDNRGIISVRESPPATTVSNALQELRMALTQATSNTRHWRNLPPLPSHQDEEKSEAAVPQETQCKIGSVSFSWRPLPPPCKTCLLRKHPAQCHAATSDSSKRLLSESKLSDTFPDCKDSNKLSITNSEFLQQSTVATTRKAIKTGSNFDINKPSTSKEGVETNEKLNNMPNRLKSSDLHTGKTVYGNSKHMLHSTEGKRKKKVEPLAQRKSSLTARSPSASLNEGNTDLQHNTNSGQALHPRPLFKTSSVSATGLTLSAARTELPFATSSSSKHPSVTSDAKKPAVVKKQAAATLRHCPLCQMQFHVNMSPVDMDGHIAACFASADDDVTW